MASEGGTWQDGAPWHTLTAFENKPLLATLCKLDLEWRLLELSEDFDHSIVQWSLHNLWWRPIMGHPATSRDAKAPGLRVFHWGSQGPWSQTGLKGCSHPTHWWKDSISLYVQFVFLYLCCCKSIINKHRDTNEAIFCDTMPRSSSCWDFINSLTLPTQTKDASPLHRCACYSCLFTKDGMCKTHVWNPIFVKWSGWHALQPPCFMHVLNNAITNVKNNPIKTKELVHA